MGPANDTTVSAVVTATKVPAGLFTQRAMTAARTMPTAVAIRVPVAKPHTGMSLPAAAPWGAASIGTPAALAMTAAAVAAAAPSTPATTPTRTSEGRWEATGGAMDRDGSVVTMAVMAMAPWCRERTTKETSHRGSSHRTVDH